MRTGRRRRRIAPWLVLVAITGALFLVLEGLSSLALSVREARQAEPPAPGYLAVGPERRHAQYDEELGWVSIPNLYLPDLYGKGRYLRTEARGFRNEHPIEDQVPEGKLRIVCSGDSFTFGQGVANNQTWCHLLSVTDDRFEAVNMGQRGYGVDQAFLWYMRDGRSLDHQIHVLAFIQADFSRMKESRHKGYGKPVLRLDHGELRVENVPVPGVRRPRPVFERLGRVARRLRSVQVAQKLLGKIFAVSEDETRAAALQVFDTLRQVNREKNSVLILLYLPERWEVGGEESRWRLWLSSVADEAGLPLLDLTPEMSGLAPETAESFFIGASSSEYTDAAGHYTERGHAWVADRLYSTFMESAEIETVLGQRRAARPAASDDAGR